MFKSLFCRVLPFCLIPLHSSAMERVFSPVDIKQLIQKNQAQAFWQNTQHSLPLSQINEWQDLHLKNQLFHNFLNHLTTDVNLITDHFYIAFSERQGFSIPTEQSKHFKTLHLLSHWFELLKKGGPEEIHKFMEEYSFTKADKIMTVLYLLHFSPPNETIFDLMKTVRLSVNDSLSFKEIKSSLIPEPFKGKDDKAVILSHHLLATRNPKIIENLIKNEIDFRVTLAVGDNIIHSYIFLNQGLDEKNRKKQAKGLKAFLQLPQSKELLTHRNSLGVTPLHLGFSHPNERIRKTLKKELKALMNPVLMIPQSYEDLWSYIAQEKPKNPSAHEVTYFNFQSILQTLFYFFARYQTQELQQALLNIFNDLQKKLKEAEGGRLLLLHDFLHRGDETAKNTRLILKAILNRDEFFFKTLDPKDGFVSTEIFTNSYYISDGTVYLSPNLLLEAIRHSFTPAVEHILEKLKKSKSAQQTKTYKMQSYSLDPLSLAFVTYGSLDSESPYKKSAKKIIKLLYESLSEFENYHFPLTLSPMDWALFFGLTEEVQFLHESKKMEISPGPSIQPNKYRLELNWDWEIYLTTQNFEPLIHYLSNQNQDSGLQKGSLEDILEKISKESSEKTKRIFSKISREEQTEQALGPELWKKYQAGQLKLEDFKDQNEDQEGACKKNFLN